MQSYNILLVDDEKDVCEVFIENAREIGIDENVDLRIVDCQNWQDGSELLQTQYFHAVILDAKCMIDREQKTEDFGFLSFALERLKEIEQKQNRHIPFAVNTGQFGERERELISNLITERKGKIFDKKKPKVDLIKFLVSEIENESDTRIEKKYYDVFEIFRKGYLATPYRADLLEILKNLEDISRLKDKFNPLRKFLESIYRAVKAKDTNLIPDIVFYNRNGKDINLDWVQRYITGQKVTIPPPPNRNGIDYQRDAIIPFHTGWSIKYLEELGSKVSHDYIDEVTNFAYKSAVFALMEILLWFKGFMERK